jgi:hypothetical protein
MAPAAMPWLEKRRPLRPQSHSSAKSPMSKVGQCLIFAAIESGNIG